MFETEKAIELLQIWALKKFVTDNSGNCLFHKCMKAPIRSHSLAKSRILEKIASDDNHVFYYDKLNRTGKVSIYDVSIFGGFCIEHDHKIFNLIDNSDYSVGNREQEFLFFYRAFCRSYIYKIISINILKRLAKLAADDKLGHINPYFKQKEFTESQKNKAISYCNREVAQEQYTLKYLQGYKTIIEDYYAAKRFDDVDSVLIELDAEYGVAAAAFFDIGSDLEGKKFPPDIAIGLTVFPQNGKTYAIFSFLNDHTEYLSFLKTDLLNANEGYQKRLISYFIANCTDNWALSPSLWNKIDGSFKKEFEYLSSQPAKKIVIDCEKGLNLFI